MCITYFHTHVCAVAGFATISNCSLSGYLSFKINKTWVTNTTARTSNGGRCRVLVPTCAPLLPRVQVASRLQSEYVTVSMVTSRPTVQHTPMNEYNINILFRLSIVGYSKCQLKWTERVGDLRRVVNTECSKCQNDHAVSYKSNKSRGKDTAWSTFRGRRSSRKICADRKLGLSVICQEYV